MKEPWSIMGVPGLDLPARHNHVLRVFPLRSVITQADRSAPNCNAYATIQKVHYITLPNGTKHMVVCPSTYGQKHESRCYLCIRRMAILYNNDLVAHLKTHEERRKLKRQILGEPHNSWMLTYDRYVSFVSEKLERPTLNDVRVISYGMGVHRVFQDILNRYGRFYSISQGFPIALIRETKSKYWEIGAYPNGDTFHAIPSRLVATREDLDIFYQHIPNLEEYPTKAYQLSNVEDGRIYSPKQVVALMEGADPRRTREHNSQLFSQHIRIISQEELDWLAELRRRITVELDFSEYTLMDYIREFELENPSYRFLDTAPGEVHSYALPALTTSLPPMPPPPPPPPPPTKGEKSTARLRSIRANQTSNSLDVFKKPPSPSTPEDD